MKVVNIFSSGAVLLCTAILSGCGDNREEPAAVGVNPGRTNTDAATDAPDARALIANATETLKSRTAQAVDITRDDVIPPEYRQGGEALANGARLAVATMAPLPGFAISGEVAFIQAPVEVEDAVAGDSLMTSPVRIIARIKGLEPGPHGFHIHEIGDCSAPDEGSAGGHYNPGEAVHGGPDSEERHVGDLGNLSADAFGMAALDVQDRWLTITGGNTVIGKALLIHADLDDLATDPDGNAGVPAACGIIDSYRPTTNPVTLSE